MKLLEDLPAIDDDFEMLLSRKVSVNTELDDPHRFNADDQMFDTTLLDEPSKVSKRFLKLYLG